MATHSEFKRGKNTFTCISVRNFTGIRGPGIRGQSPSRRFSPLAIQVGNFAASSDLLDSDGMTNLEESTYGYTGTNPYQRDTDGDTFSDGDEVKNNCCATGFAKCDPNVDEKVLAAILAIINSLLLN